VYVVQGDGHDIESVRPDGSLAAVARSEGTVRKALPDGRGGLIVIRDDLAIERHVPGRPAETVGRFNRADSSSDGTGLDVSLVDADLLLRQPFHAASEAPSEPLVAEIFDLATRRLLAVPTPRGSSLRYARLRQGPRLIFDAHGFVADIDRPPDAASVMRSAEEAQDSVGEYPFDALAEASCLPDTANLSEYQSNGIRTALEEAGARGSYRFGCQMLGEHVLIEVERSTSAGLSRRDVMVDGLGNRQEVLAPPRGFGLEPPNLTWASMSSLGTEDWEDDVVALVEGRRVFVHRLVEDEVVLDRTFAYPVTFAAFVSETQLVVAAQGRPELRVLDLAPRSPFATRSLQGTVDDNFEPALHPTACRNRPYRGVMAGGGTLTLDAVSAGDDGSGPTAFRVRVEDIPVPFETTFLSPESQRCVAVAPGGRHIAVGSGDGRMEIHDLVKAMRGQPSKIGEFEADAWGDPGMSGWSTIFFAGPEPTIISASGGEPVVKWVYDETTAAWTSSELFRGDLPVRSAEPDATGRRLLLREDLGHGDVSARIYSLEARRTWRELGRDYKWLFVMFNARGEALVAEHRRWLFAARLLGLDEAVALARALLSERCRDFAGDAVRTSLCWPAALGS
jgi:hypothetical protein